MKSIITSLFLSLGLLSATVAQTSEVKTSTAAAWTPSGLQHTLAALPTGDALRGAELNHGYFCQSCHGDVGLSPSRSYPHLAGQRSTYMAKTLLDYRSALRNEGNPQAEIMVEIAAVLSDQDIADLAAFYQQQALPAVAVKTAASSVESLVRHGDPQRLITPCASCHGVHGEGGINETPAISGQAHDYFVRTMHAYRDRSRSNDLYQAMHIATQQLSDAEIQALARYYNPQP